MNPELLTSAELVDAARRRLSGADWDWLVGGAESETTARRNRLSLDCIALRPRVLVGVADVDPSTALLGCHIPLPLLLANLGDPHRLCEGGSDAVARAGSELGIPRFVRPERRAAKRDRTRPAPLDILEISAHRNASEILELVRTAEQDGCLAVCLGLVPHESGRLERDAIERPSRPRATRDAWHAVEIAVEHSALPVMAKGVMGAADAVAAVDRGCAAVYVSNYGGRALDHGEGAIDVLPEVVDAVCGRAEVVIDGGFHRGTDVAKALATGARAVAIGRFQGFGLAAGGATALIRALEILGEELTVTLSLLGATTVDRLGRDHLHLDAAPVQLPHETSAHGRSIDGPAAVPGDLSLGLESTIERGAGIRLTETTEI